MKFTSTCLHDHCGEKISITHAKDEKVVHFTCDECSWPLKAVPGEDEKWYWRRGDWGPAGDHDEFHWVHIRSGHDHAASFTRAA